jgi:hypothetical protein
MNARQLPSAATALTGLWSLAPTAGRSAQGVAVPEIFSKVTVPRILLTTMTTTASPRVFIAASDYPLFKFDRVSPGWLDCRCEKIESSRTYSSVRDILNLGTRWTFGENCGN